MSDRISIKAASMFKKKNFTDLTIYDVNNNFTSSGSRIFGGSTEDSDYDFLVSPNYNLLAFAICKFFKAEREDYYSEEIYSYSFTIKSGEKINLILFKAPYHYEGWTFATRNMKRLYRSGTPDMELMMEDKKTRCDLFQYFVGMYLKNKEFS